MVLRDVFIGIWATIVHIQHPLKQCVFGTGFLGHPGAYQCLQPEVHGEVLEVIGVP